MNIMSLDCDVLYRGNTYHKYTNFDVSPELAWDIIELCKREDKDIDTDINKNWLDKVIEVFHKKCSKAKFRFITEHDEIIHVMEEYKVKDATIYNFDAHCDITYDGDDSTLNIENWVRFAKAKGLMKEYHWIYNAGSDLRGTKLFNHYRTYIEDVHVENMNDIDLVVICLSKHFTPKKDWNILPNVLLSYKEIGEWREIAPNSFNLEGLKGLETYLLDGTLPSPNRVFKNNLCKGYVLVEDHNLSIVCFDSKLNMFSCKELLDYLLDDLQYVQFDYDTKARNKVFIERLVKNYNIDKIEEYMYNGIKCKSIIIKKGDKNDKN